MNRPNKKLLLLGGTGFLGSSLVPLLVANGYAVRVFSRNAATSPAWEGVEYLEGDIGNIGQLHEAFDGVSMVAHFVSTTYPGSSERDILFDIKSNLESAINVLDLCVAYDIDRFFYCSSGGTVYGVQDALPIPETALPAPISSYGIVKYTIENYIRYYGHRHDLPYLILRPSNPYGPNQRPQRPQGIISVTLGNILSGRPVTVFGDGSVVRDYLYISDFCEFFLKCLDSRLVKETLNIGSGIGHSIRDVLDVLQEVTGKPFPIVHQPSREFDVPRNYLEINKAKQLLDWSPKVSLREGVALMYAAFQAKYDF